MSFKGSHSSASDISSGEVEHAGWLNKWTNYIKGYRQRWFVLDGEAFLSYYRNQQEVGQTCRGSINLKEAQIYSEEDTNNIVVSASSQTFHLKAPNEVERKKWVSSLERSRHKAIRQAESDEDEEAHISSGETRTDALFGIHEILAHKLNELKMSAKMLEKTGDELIKCVNEPDIDKKTLTERTALLKITTSSVVNACEEFVNISQKGARRLEKVVASEQREKQMLHEQLETLAKQHSSLERAATVGSSSNFNHNEPLSAYSDQEDEFHDAAEELSMGDRKGSSSGHSTTDHDHRHSHPTSNGQVAVYHNNNKTGLPQQSGPPRIRRTRIPDRPDLPINLWSIMKNCIGKELSKIPMPVNFSEPLSVLQRITEDLEYAHLLEQGAKLSSLEQMCYVAAYAVSIYSTTANRTNKPFNPLLGETYECDRLADRGWRSITEQVSHHPPAAAHHADGNGWTMFQDFILTSRFRGKYLSVTPVGYSHIHFPASGNKYSYQKITTTVHNIIVGKLWIDNHGEMNIVNHTTGDKCVLKFIPYSYFSKDTPRKIYGVVKNNKGEPKYVVQGTWDHYVDMVEVEKYTGSGDKMKIETSVNTKRLWTCNPPYPDSDKMHNFTKFTIELNEPEEGVAPTDTRLRPDQRLMEKGSWDESNKKKLEIEEKQRAVRRKREAEMERAMAQGRDYQEYTPLWFTKTQDELTGALVHKFKGEYWDCKEKQDWTRCPNIY